MFGGAYGDACMPNWPHWHRTPLPGIATTGLRRDKGGMLWGRQPFCPHSRLAIRNDIGSHCDTLLLLSAVSLPYLYSTFGMSATSSLRILRVQYCAREKRKIIIFAEAHGNRKASREFDVAESNVRLWRRNHDRLFWCESWQISFPGRKPFHLEVEENTAEYVRGDLNICT